MRVRFRAASTQIGEIAHAGINDQFAAVVVVADLEANLVVGELTEAAGHGFLGVTVRLIDGGGVKADVAVAGREHQVARV